MNVAHVTTIILPRMYLYIFSRFAKYTWLLYRNLPSIWRNRWYVIVFIRPQNLSTIHTVSPTWLASLQCGIFQSLHLTSTFLWNQSYCPPLSVSMFEFSLSTSSCFLHGNWALYRGGNTFWKTLYTSDKRVKYLVSSHYHLSYNEYKRT